MVIISNEYVASASLFSLYGDNIEYSDKQGIVSNTYFESIIPSIQMKLFHQRMIDFVNKLELSYQKYHTNVNIRD